jgi:hypothetical protein
VPTNAMSTRFPYNNTSAVDLSPENIPSFLSLSLLSRLPFTVSLSLVFLLLSLSLSIFLAYHLMRLFVF